MQGFMIVGQWIPEIPSKGQINYHSNSNSSFLQKPFLSMKGNVLLMVLKLNHIGNQIWHLKTHNVVNQCDACHQKYDDNLGSNWQLSLTLSAPCTVYVLRATVTVASFWHLPNNVQGSHKEKMGNVIKNRFMMSLQSEKP